ncbi:MAG: hypothetical protein OWQ48_01315 [Desulfurococcus sp.]|nr:hypothetical protein [Desulfurococcus sp.]
MPEESAWLRTYYALLFFVTWFLVLASLSLVVLRREGLAFLYGCM